MVEELRDITFFLTIKDVVGRLFVALVCGILISIVYRLTYRGLSYSSSFVNSLILLTMITAVVIMVIGNNLAAAFGLVGAMSIIRFRTAVKDTQDIMFIFFSLAIGLACGVDFTSVAILGTIMIGTIFLIIVKMNFATPRKKDYLLQLMISGSASDNSVIDPILSRYCRNYKVINVKAVGEDAHDMLEVSYYVKLKSEDNSQKFVRDMRKLEGVRYANLFFDEE